MKENACNGNLVTPMLFPCEPERFWKFMRQFIREGVSRVKKEKSLQQNRQIAGMSFQPLYKMAEVCALFHVTKPTIYDLLKHGKLRSYEIRSRIYFLEQDNWQLLDPNKQ